MNRCWRLDEDMKAVAVDVAREIEDIINRGVLSDSPMRVYLMVNQTFDTSIYFYAYLQENDMSVTKTEVHIVRGVEWTPDVLLAYFFNWMYKRITSLERAVEIVFETSNIVRGRQGFKPRSTPI